MNVDVRLAVKDDLPDLVRLNEQIQFQHAEQYPSEFKYPTKYEEISNFFEELIDIQSTVLIIANVEDQIIGYLYYEIHNVNENPFKFGKKRCYIHHILVDHTYRRAGVGSSLIAWVEDAANTENASEIVLDTMELNHVAHRYFEQSGFRISQFKYTKSTNLSKK